MELHQISIKELKKFGIIFGTALFIIGTVQLFKGKPGLHLWFYAFGSFSAAVAIFMPQALKPIYFLLNKAGHTIGTLATVLILIVVFFAAVFPIGLLARAFGSIFLDTNFDKKGNTYWIKKETLNEGKLKYEKQF